MARPSPSGAAPAARAPKSFGRSLLRWLRRLLVLGLVLSALGALCAALVLKHFEAGLPSLDELRRYNPPQLTRILARDGRLLGELFLERRTVVPISDVPPQVKLAVLAAEDAGFYEHQGLEYTGMLRAVLVNLRGGKARQGASTITQQLVKNILLTPERTVSRKLREVLLARRIETALSKDEILELYLNHIYFGHGRWGVEEAARLYFGKGVRDVSLSEAALLAAVIKGPSVFSPKVDLPRATERRQWVLDQMAAKRFAPSATVDAAKLEPVRVAPESVAAGELAPEVIDEVRRTLRTLLGADAERGGYTVRTTLDPELQASARQAVRKALDDYLKRQKLSAPLLKGRREPAVFEGTPAPNRTCPGVVVATDDAAGTVEIRVGSVTGVLTLAEAARYNPANLPPSKFTEPGKVLRVSLVATVADRHAPGGVPAGKPKLRLELGPEGALVAIDARTREILALVGSYEAQRGGLDRASHARRQPGSTFKPFVYGYGLAQRLFTPATIVETDARQLTGYRPDNFDEGEGKHPKRLRDAVAQSVNVAAVYAIERVGAQRVVAFAKELGIESKLGPDASLALGAHEVTPRELAGAYATFAGGGTYEAPVLIREIVGPGGVKVELPARPAPRRAMEPAAAYVLTSVLTSVVQEGTGRRARALGRAIAGKTGTSNDAKDTWFAGYSTDIACVVWVGYDEPLPLGAGEQGAVTALPAFVEFMKAAHAGRKAVDFPMPAGVVRVPIDRESGLRALPDQADALDEVFIAGTEPTEFATPDAGAPDASPELGPPTTVPGGAGPADPMPPPF